MQMFGGAVRKAVRWARRDPVLVGLVVVVLTLVGILALKSREGWAFMDDKPEDITLTHRDRIGKLCARGVTMDDLTKTADWDYLAKYDRDEVAALCTQARTEARARAAQYATLNRAAQCKAAGREQCPFEELRVDYPCANKDPKNPKCCGYDGKYCVPTTWAANLRLPPARAAKVPAPKVKVYAEPGYAGQAVDVGVGASAVLNGHASSLRIPPNTRVTLENELGGKIYFNGGADGLDVGSLRFYSAVTNRLVPIRVKNHWDDRARRIKVEAGRFDLDGGDHGNLRTPPPTAAAGAPTGTAAGAPTGTAAGAAAAGATTV